jgi:hypothetical protein
MLRKPARRHNAHKPLLPASKPKNVRLRPSGTRQKSPSICGRNTHGLRRMSRSKYERLLPKYMREEYPRFKADIQKQIREASAHGRRDITVVDPPNHAWQALEEELRANGYSIGSRFTHGEYENMGDSSAPCNIWRDSYWSYKVGW